MNRNPCSRCVDPASLLHHPTGRSFDGAYLDQRLVSELCHDCHEAEHDLLRALALDEPASALSFVETIEWRLRRMAVHLQNLRSTHPLFLRLSEALTRWAGILACRRRVKTDPVLPVEI